MKQAILVRKSSYKTSQGKAVNRAERECREDKCGNVEDGLQKDICIRKCVSFDCYQEIYAWNEVTFYMMMAVLSTF